MKKILGALLLVIVMFSCKKIYALEYTYSDWSSLYPSGMDPVFIESEVRYKWDKFEDNNIGRGKRRLKAVQKRLAEKSASVSETEIMTF